MGVLEHARDLCGRATGCMHGARRKVVKWSTPEDEEEWSLKQIFTHIWTLKGVIFLVLAFLLPLDLIFTAGEGLPVMIMFTRFRMSKHLAVKSQFLNVYGYCL